MLHATMLAAAYLFAGSGPGETPAKQAGREGKPRAPVAAPFVGELEKAIADEKQAETAAREARLSGQPAVRVAELGLALRKAGLARATAEHHAAEKILTEAQRRHAIEVRLANKGDDLRFVHLVLERCGADRDLKAIGVQLATIELQMAEVRLQQLRGKK